MRGAQPGRAGRLLVVAALALSLAAGPTAQHEQIPDDYCTTCHEDYGKAMRATAHQLASTMMKPTVPIACADCHQGGADHVEDPRAENIGRPNKMPTGEVQAVCTQCHNPHTQTGTLAMDPHAHLNLACTDCHSIHDQTSRLELTDFKDFCGQCHVAVSNRFRSRSAHPLMAGTVTCLDCHSFRDTDGQLAYGHGPQETCSDCHPEVAGPYRYEHDATSSFAPEGEGCTACHHPHGSPNDRLLKQPDDRMCRQCHGLPPLHATQHDGIGTMYGCIDCHTGVHGSNDHQALLDPLLGIRIGGEPEGCFCHGVDN